MVRDLSSLDFAQRLLPPGLVLIEQLAVPEQRGMAFKAEDRRLSDVTPSVRLIRVIEARESNGWREKWFSQLRELTKNTFQHVCRPLELGVAESDYVYLVFDWFPATLAEKIPATGLANSSIGQSILSQLAAGLDELHGRFGPHGGLCAENIFVDTTTLREETRIWIGGVELGHLPYWTDGAYLVAGSHKFFPPEWQGTLCEPSKSADVFSLGLLAVEVLAGRNASVRVSETPEKASAGASRILKQRCPWWKRPHFVPKLLGLAKQRPRDGLAVKQSFDWWLWCEQTVTYSVATLATLMLLMVSVWWHEEALRNEHVAAIAHATNQNSRLTGDNHSLRRQVDESQAKVAEAETKIAVLQKKIEDVGKTPNTPKPLGDPLSNAKELWSTKLARKLSKDHDAILDSLEKKPSEDVRSQLKIWITTVRGAWDGINHSWTEEQKQPEAKKTGREAAYYKLRREPWNETLQLDLVKEFWHDFAAGESNPTTTMEGISAAFEKVPTTSWLRSKLSEQITPLRARQLAWRRWETQPLNLTEPWLKRINDPWNTVAISQEEESLAALEIAEREWRKVDGRGDLSWSDFQAQLKTAVEATGNKKTETIAKVWIDAFNSMTGVSFQLVAGTSPKGSGKHRVLDVHVDRSYLPLDDAEAGSDWSDEMSYTYPESTPSISFPWRPGQKFQITVYGERQSLRVLTRPTYISQTFTGPVAVWRLAQAGKIQTDNHSLTLRVIDCPGPPPLPEEPKKVIEALK